MIKLLHKIFHHRIWLLPIPIVLIGTPLLILVHEFFSWASIWAALGVIMWFIGGIIMVIVGFVVIGYILEERK